MDEKIQTIKRIVFELRKDFGNVISVDEVVKMGVAENVCKEDVLEVIKNLEEEGIIRALDKDTIEVTG
jgi:DNA-binding Lrp family transcriptional regulator